MQRIRSAVAGFIATFVVFSQVPQSSLNVWEKLEAEPTHAQSTHPDIEVTMVAPVDVTPGDTFKFEVKYRNKSSNTLPSALLADPIDLHTDELTFLPAQSGSPTHPGVTCSKAGQFDPVVCTDVTLAPNATATYNLYFKVKDDAHCPSSFDNLVDIYVPSTNTQVWSNQTTTQVKCPLLSTDLKIDKTGPATVQPGTSVTYALTVTHVSGAPATNVTVVDPIPTGLTFNASLSSPSCHISGNEVECTLNTLAPNQSHTFSVGFNVPQSAACGSQVKNTAAVFSDQGDPDDNNNIIDPPISATVECPQPKADLTIQKSGPATVTAGSTVNYTLTASNAGPNQATGVVVRDPIPSGLSFNAGASSPECILVGSDVKCMNFDLASGQSRSFTVAFNVPAQPCGGTIQNSANIFMGGSVSDPNPNNNNSQTVTTNVQCPPPQGSDLSVTKTGPASVQRGGQISYTLTAKNAGPAQAVGVVVRDPIPQGLSVSDFNAGSSSPECILVGSDVKCMNFDLAVNQTRSFTVTFDVPTVANCSQSQVTNTANIFMGGSTSDPNPGNNSSQTVTTSITCPVQQPPKYTVTKSAPSQVTVGDEFKYTITWTNTGTVPVVNAILADAIDLHTDDVTFQPQKSGSTSHPQIHCSKGSSFGDPILCDPLTLSPGQSATYELWFRVNGDAHCPAIIENIADVHTASPNTTVWSNTTQTQVVCPPPQGSDLSIVKTGPSSVQRGGVVSYSVTATNHGPGTATNVVVADVIPVGLTAANFNAAQSSQGCVLNGAQTSVLCNNFNLASGESRTFTIAFTTPASTGACVTGTLHNVATVSASSTDPNASNNVSQTVTTSVQCPVPQGSDLSVQKSGPSSVQRGSTISYTLTAFNAGPAQATGVIVRDPIPSGLSFNAGASSPECILVGTDVKCMNFDLAAGQSRTFTVTFNVPASTGQCSPSQITNVANIFMGGSASDPNPGNNTSQTVVTSLTCPPPLGADVSIVKTGPATVTRGGTIAYSVTAFNAGPGQATNVVIADVIPVGLTAANFNAAQSSPGCVLNGSQTSVLCNNFSLNSGESRSFTIVFNVPAAVGQCSTGTLHNVATVSTSSTDPNSSNNTSQTVITAIQCPPPTTTTLIIDKTGVSSVQRGQTLTYPITVTNVGQVAAQNVIVTDPVPLGLTFIPGSSDQQCSVSQGAVKCLLGTLGAGQARTIVLAFNVPSIDPCVTGTVQNRAFATSDQSVQADSQTIHTSITCPVPLGADVSIVKTGPASVQRGNVVNYSVTATNNGPGAATNVVVADVIPAGLTAANFNAALSSQGCVLNGAQTSVLCNNFNLNVHESRTFTIAFTVPASSGQCVTGTLYNVATVSTSSTDPNSSNNVSQTVTTSITCPTPTTTTLTIQKSGPATVQRGQTISYSLTVENVGQVTAQNVTITDPVPFGLTFLPLSSDSRCTVAQGIVSCNVGILAASQTVTLALAFQVPTVEPCVASSIPNQAQVTSNQSVVAQSQIVQTAVTCPVPLTADLSILKSGVQTVSRGSVLSYSVIVTNNGPGVATNVVIADVIPAGLSGGLLNVGQTSAGCALNGAQTSVLCNNFSLNAGEQRQFTIAFNIPSAGACPATLQNVATVSTSSTDPISANNTSQTVTTQITCPEKPDVVVEKTGPSSVTRGGTFTYTLTARNLTNALAQNVFVTDAVPSGLTYLSSNSSSECVLQGTVVSCNLSTLLGNQVKVLTLNFSVPTVDACTQTSVQNTASITTTTAESNGSNNQSPTVTTQILCPTTTQNFSIFKTDNRSTAEIDDELKYDITVTNNATTSQTNITVTDTLPTDVDFLSATDNATVNGRTVTWSNQTFSANQTRIYTVRVRITDDVDDGDLLTNTATVAGVTATDTTRIEDEEDVETSIDITDSPDPVRVGEELRYTISLRNDDNDDVRVDIRGILDECTTFLEASNGGEDVDDGEVEWQDIRIDRNGTTFLTLLVGVDECAEDGDQLRFHAETDDDEDEELTRVVDDVVIVDENASVFIAKQSDRSEAYPGDYVYYSVTVRNTSNVPAENILVGDSYPDDKLVISDAGDAQASAGRIQWNIGTLAPNETRTFTYRGQVRTGLTHGDLIVNTARVTGGNLDSSPSATVEVRVISQLPQTGIEDFTQPIENVSQFLRPFSAASNGSSTIPAIVWSAIVMLGMSAGGVMGKRFFL